MTKRKVHLTESQLHRLIEQSINEISTETKMSAANKANQERTSYRRQASGGGKNPLLRKYLSDMGKKRARQADVFSKGAADDVRNSNGVTDALFFPTDPDLCGFSPQRGALVANEPYYYGQHSRHLHCLNPDRDRWEDYLQGNSYFENGKWMRPDDEGYDMEKSEPWARIRQNNESIARRVTESVMRKLKRDLREWKDVGNGMIEFGNAEEALDFVKEYRDDDDNLSLNDAALTFGCGEVYTWSDMAKEFLASPEAKGANVAQGGNVKFLDFNDDTSLLAYLRWLEKKEGCLYFQASPDDEDAETPKVETYTDLLDYGLTPETVLGELDASLSADERNELMDGMWEDYDLEYDDIDRRDYKYLSDLVDYQLFNPSQILEFADQFFGRGKTRGDAQRMMDLLWNN